MPYTPHPSLRRDLAEWRVDKFNERLAQCEAKAPGYTDKWDRMCERIASTGHDGDVIVGLDGPDRRIDLLIAEGRLFPDGERRRDLGIANQCHANSIRLVEAFRSDGMLVGTGFASYGGDWYSHSWGVDRNASIVETTKNDFTLYWGIVLSLADAYDLLP